MISKLQLPHALSGTAQEQLAQINNYLYQLSEAVAIALASVDGRISTATETKTLSLSVGGRSVDVPASTYEALRQLIIQTAQVIQVNKDELLTILSENYAAMSSNFGTFTENIETTITETAREVISEYNYDTALLVLNDAVAEFSDYKVHTEGFIRQGFVATDGSGVPILGIAIGQNLTSTTYTYNGEEYERLDDTQNMALFTATELAFYVDGAKVAYVSNGRFMTDELEVDGPIYLGSDWAITYGNGFSIMWVGS